MYLVQMERLSVTWPITENEQVNTVFSIIAPLLGLCTQMILTLEYL